MVRSNPILIIPKNLLGWKYVIDSLGDFKVNDKTLMKVCSFSNQDKKLERQNSSHMLEISRISLLILNWIMRSVFHFSSIKD